VERGGQSLIRLPNLIPFKGWQREENDQHPAHRLGALNLMFCAVGPERRARFGSTPQLREYSFRS